MFANNDGTFQFKIQFFKMIRHANNITRALNTMMIGIIKYRVLVKLRNHFHFPFSSCCCYMLPKSIAVTA